ncbi:hypothetical protein AB669_11485 [Pedobacter sp. BMA]|nr:hypothetical protein AB669_11485 [Pedobacter sp. BMA]
MDSTTSCSLPANSISALKTYFLNILGHVLLELEKKAIMGNLLYIIAVVLVIIWLISFLGGYYTGGIIHSLLVIAVIAVVWRLLVGR